MSIDYAKEHRELLDYLYNEINDLFTGFYGVFNEFCPTIVGGYAYMRHMEALGITPLFSDDIDIKFVSRFTKDDINKNPALRKSIKYFRYLVIYSVIHRFVPNFLTTQSKTYFVKIKLAGAYSSLQDLLNDLDNDIDLMKLCALCIEYFDTQPYATATPQFQAGLIDTTFFIRDSRLPHYAMHLRFQNKVMVGGYDDTLIAKAHTCDILGKSSYTAHAAHIEFIMLDTVRMLLKPLLLNHPNAIFTAGLADVYKFEKYLIKFLQICHAIGKRHGFMGEYSHFELSKCGDEYRKYIAMKNQHSSTSVNVEQKFLHDMKCDKNSMFSKALKYYAGFIELPADIKSFMSGGAGNNEPSTVVSNRRYKAVSFNKDQYSIFDTTNNNEVVNSRSLTNEFYALKSPAHLYLIKHTNANGDATYDVLDKDEFYMEFGYFETPKTTSFTINNGIVTVKEEEGINRNSLDIKDAEQLFQPREDENILSCTIPLEPGATSVPGGGGKKPKITRKKK